MAKNNKKQSEEQLEKRRLARRLKYQEIKRNPEKYAHEQTLKRINYLKKKHFSLRPVRSVQRLCLVAFPRSRSGMSPSMRRWTSSILRTLTHLWAASVTWCGLP